MTSRVSRTTRCAHLWDKRTSPSPNAPNPMMCAVHCFTTPPKALKRQREAEQRLDVLNIVALDGNPNARRLAFSTTKTKARLAFRRTPCAPEPIESGDGVAKPRSGWLEAM
eukprot:Sspe_Gene.93557::Locus_66155_Transcript_2_4_Confidence_0.625_Length_485::g.93557::m.93557